MSIRLFAYVFTAFLIAGWVSQTPKRDLRNVPTAQLRREIIQLGLECSRTPALSQLRMAAQQKQMADELIRRGAVAPTGKEFEQNTGN